MTPETIKYILELLETNADEIRSDMLRAIEAISCPAEQVMKKIDYYQQAYKALDDFKDWIDEQEDN